MFALQKDLNKKLCIKTGHFLKPKIKYSISLMYPSASLNKQVDQNILQYFYILMHTLFVHLLYSHYIYVHVNKMYNQ